MRIFRIWNPFSTPPAGASAGYLRRLAIQVHILRGAHRLQCIGHRQRQAGERMPADRSLRVRDQQADVDLIARVFELRLRQHRFQIHRLAGQPRLIQSAVQRTRVGNQNAQSFLRRAAPEA